MNMMELWNNYIVLNSHSNFFGGGVMPKKYYDCKEDVQFELKSADGSLNETLLIPKMLVEDIDRTVEFIKSKYGEDVADGVFNAFLEFCLMYTMDFLNKDNNLDKVLGIVGDSNGN